MERWDLYTQDRKLTGQTMVRGEAIPAGLYHLVVGIWTINSQGRVLLTLRHPNKEVYPNTWENSGGAAKAGESSLEAAQRELEEETGYRAANYTSLGCMYPTPGCCDEKVYIYLATGLTQSEAHPDSDEFLAVERCPLDEMVKRVLAGEITDAKTQIGILKTKLLLDSQKEEA